MQLYFQGLMIGLAYVAPIGMQNIFVINSALTQPRRRAALTALIIIFFDVGLAFFCYFGLGAIVERLPWLQMAVMSIGGLVVMWIGLGLLRDKPSMDHSADMDIPLPKVAWKSFAVTWLNPQALIDGAMLFGGFRAGHPGLGGVQLVLGGVRAVVQRRNACRLPILRPFQRTGSAFDQLNLRKHPDALRWTAGLPVSSKFAVNVDKCKNMVYNADSQSDESPKNGLKI